MMAEASDHMLAKRAATLAGELLMTLRQEAKDANLPSKRIGEIGDAQSHKLLCAFLNDTFPDDAILSEEQVDDLARLDAGRVWIIDPLDGTREFSEGDRDDWAVHVALVENQQPTVGAVALPSLKTTFCSNAKISLQDDIDQIRVICSRTRPGPAAELLANELSADLIYMGSAGAKAMAVVRGDAEIYAHTGGQYEWDSCAPVAVAVAHGLHASRLDGSPLKYNQSDTYLPDLLICRKELITSVLTILN
ncbi:MAG: 3'(2'),5'-bisphosphate nucleotidase CysQ [Acidimicrobiales bacterium]|jgi:3'(2'), 5'-bisphosphate nucleotidase|nr:3'(2'),5'-bisphosphate nucleotidase CysQ [Acidimicrobiales bacterium]HJM98485.1 3'(2'),5'-bisphosphate nucleotidase CysQ [Acidimicrobiales bacterium]